MASALNQDQKSKKPQWARDEVAEKLISFEEKQVEKSQRQWSEEESVPRTTLQYWLQRKANLSGSPIIVQCFESPDGIAFLHRLINAAHFSFTKIGTGSIHNVVEFLKLSGLNEFVASSYGVHQQLSSKMDKHIGVFGKEEMKRLAAQMPNKSITLCEDETFHPEVCLVGIEPYSNFIIAEQYAEDRKGETWNTAIEEALEDLPVKVLQSCSDEGKSLLYHVEHGLQAHHSPDLFHVQHEVIKGTSGALASKVKKAEQEYQQKRNETHKLEKKTEKEKMLNPSNEEGSATCLAIQAELEDQAKKELEKVYQQQEQVKQANKEISANYHPYNLTTGRQQTAFFVKEKLDYCFTEIKEGTSSLSDKCKKHVDKAYRVVDKMVATITFFFSMTAILTKEMQLSEEIESMMHTHILPGCYLLQAAKKLKDKELQAKVTEKGIQLLAPLHNKEGPFAHYSDQEVTNFEKQANNLAALFQRSSSCVEGRNAQLSLKHHCIHRLSHCKLTALTVIHNFYIKRRDRTTPAERFFEAKPNNLFDYLLDRMELPARPRKNLAWAS